MPNFQRTAYYLDVDAIREAVLAEVAVRGVNYVEIQEATGVLAAGIGRFLNPNKELRTSVSGDALITLIKWAGLEVNRFVRRRKTIAKHTDSHEQRKLRLGQEYLKSQGVEIQQGETSVDVLMRLVAEAKAKGFLS